MAAIRFCGASVLSFGSSIGWNGQSSTFKCEVVEDVKAGDVFIPPVTGTPIYFRFFGFNFFGLLQNWRKSNSTQGLPVFDVEGMSPTDILAGTQIITGGYSGATGIVANLINTFGYWENTGYGNSGSDQTGMPWATVFSGINAIVNGNLSAYGGAIKWRGVQYGLDLSRLPLPPAYYRINTPSVGLVELISQLCDDCGYDWFVELVPSALRPIIRIRTQNRRLQPPLGTIFKYTNTNYGNVMSSASGLESRGDGITSSFLVGSNIQYLSTTDNITQFWGYDTLNRPILSSVERQLIPYPDTVVNANPLPAPAYLGYWNEYPTAILDNIATIRFENNAEITIITRLAHGLQTGDSIYLAGINLGGNLNRLNDRWVITRINATTFTLNESDRWIGLIDVNNAGRPLNADIAITNGTWTRAIRTVPTFLAADLNATPIADVIGATYYHVNEYELRCALASEETWVTYMSTFRNWTAATNLRYANGYYQTDMGARVGITSAYGDSVRLFANMFQNAPGFVLNTIPRPQLPGDTLNDRPGDVRREAIGQLTDATIKRKKLYEFVKFYAQEFYGKRFWVGVPFVLAKVDPYTSKMQFSQEPCDGGWVEETDTPLGLLPINHDFFRTPDGKFGSIMRWTGLPGSDLSSFDAANTITQGTELYIKSQVAPQIVNIPWPAVMMSVSKPIYQEATTGLGSLPLLAALFNTDPAGMRQLGRGIANGRLPIKIHPEPRWPISAGVPMKNNLLSYGPWYLSGPPGRVRYEQNDYAPWQFGSVQAMNSAALARVTDSVTFMQEGETGDLRLVGAPTIGLGDTLQAGGPNMTGIDVEYGKNGINTTLRFRTYTNGFGNNRQATEYTRRLGQSSYEMRRMLRASINTALFQGERESAAAIAYNQWMQQNRPRRVAQFTPHDAFTAQVVKENYFHIDGASRVSAATATIDEALMDIQPDYEELTAISSVSSLLRPLCTKEGTNPYMSCYTTPKISNIAMNSETLDPFQGHNDIEYMTYGSLEYEGVAQFRNAPSKTANRVIGLRGPLVITGWGRDIEGYPTPNKLDNEDNRTNEFVDNYKLKSQQWSSGPVDFLFDQQRGVWTCHDLLLGKVIGAIPAYGTGRMEVYSNDPSGTGWEIDVYNWFSSPLSGENLRIQAGYFVTLNKWVVVSADCADTSGAPTGSGDVISDAVGVVTDGEMVLFSGTDGHHIKPASTTGIVKLTAGVVSTASALDLGSSDISGTLADASFPALVGDISTTAGSLTTAIGAGKVTNAMLAGGIDLPTKVTGTLPTTSLPAFTGDVTTSGGSAATTIGNSVITLGKMADVATSTVFYRKTAGTGAPEVNTLATLKTDLGLTGTNSGDQTITLTGNVTGSGTGSFATTIGTGVVTNSMLAGNIDPGKIADQAQNQVFAGPAMGGSGPPFFRQLDTTDLPSQLLLSNTSSAAGTDQSTATAITGIRKLTDVISVATGTGVKLPGSYDQIVVRNEGANPLLVYPSSGYAIDGYIVNSAVTLPVGGIMNFYCSQGTTSYAFRGMTFDSANPVALGSANTGASYHAARSDHIHPAADLGTAQVTGTLAAGRFPALTGDVTTTAGSLATTIAAGAVSLSKMTDMATASLIYRKTAGSGVPEVNTLATLKTDLGLTGTNSGDQTITLTGDVTGSGTGSFAATIANSAITLSKMADVATASVFYRKTAGTGAPEVNTLATLKTDLGLTGTNSGDQTITLTGDITGTGTGSFATAIGSGKVTNTMLAGSIDLTTKVTGVLPVDNGGVGVGTLAAHGVVIGNGTSAVAVTGAGTANQIFTSNGASADPTFQALPSSVNGESQLASAFSISAANGTYQDTGLSITLPSAGTYLITANIRTGIAFSAGTQGYILIKLFNSTDAADVAGSERMCFYLTNVNQTIIATTPLHIIVTVTASKTIKLYANRNSATTWVVSDVESDGSGRSRLGYVKFSN